MSANDLYGSAPTLASAPSDSPAPRSGSANDLYGAPTSQRRPHRSTAQRVAHELGVPGALSSRRSRAARAANDLYGASAAAAAPSNPLADAARGALSATGAIATRLGVPRVMDIASRPGKAGAAFFAGDEPGQIAHAFTSGDDEQYAADIDRVKQHLGLKHGGPEETRFGAPVLFDSDKLPPVGRGVVDFLTQMVVDPTTLVGGPAVRGAGRVVEAAGKVAEAGLSKTKAGRDALDVARAASDAMTFGGSAKRELGSERYHGAIAADNRQAAREAEAARRLDERRANVFDHLDPNEKTEVFRILNGERQTTDPVSGRLIVSQRIADAATAGRKLFNDAAALQGDAGARRRLGYGMAPLANAKLSDKVEPWKLSYAKPGYADRSYASPKSGEMRAQLTHTDDTVKPAGGPRRIVGRVDRSYELPEDLREFAAPDDQGVLGARNLRRDYLPAPHVPPAVASKSRPQSFNLLRPFSPNALQRDAFTVAPDDVSSIDEAIKSALRSAARQGAAGRLRQEVGAPLSVNAAGREPTALEQLFDVTPRATGDARTRSEKAADLMRGVTNISKEAVTAFGLKHGAVNVPTLAAMSEGPGAALEALVRGAQLSRKTGADRYEALRTGIEGGVISPFDDRKSALADAASKLPLIGKPLGALGKGTNALTWAIDDAAKQAVYRRKIARGMSPSEAAGQALREMIDYRHRSKVTKALADSGLAPFATFRSRMPAAIASSTSRVPARALALDRATQGYLGNGRVDVTDSNDTSHRINLSNPFSDVVSLTEEPQKYARAMASDPLRALLSSIPMDSEYFDPRTGSLETSLRRNYSTYGEPLLPHGDPLTGKPKAGFIASQAANYLPFGLGDALLKATGTNEFPAEDWLSTLLGGALGVHVR